MYCIVPNLHMFQAAADYVNDALTTE